MVRIAVVGAGFMGTTHVKAYLRMSDAKVTAVCNSGEEKGRALAELAGCPWYGDFEKMLAEHAGEIDAVDICLPTDLHEQYALAAAGCGKQIICEKPAALTAGSFDAMVYAANRAGVHLYIGQVIRFWPEYVKAREMAQSGDFGEIRYIRATRMSCVSERAKKGGWFTKTDRSGGGLLDLHIHDVDFLCSVFGKVKSVYAVGAKNEAGCWNYVISSLKFENGLYAVAEGVSEMPKGFPFTMELNISGDRKAFCYRMGAGENLYNISAASRTSVIYSEEDPPEVRPVPQEDAYYLELREFVSCIAENRECALVTAESVRETLTVIEAIRRSLETGHEVVLC